jgi:hypothetical protein
MVWELEREPTLLVGITSRDPASTEVLKTIGSNTATFAEGTRQHVSREVSRTSSYRRRVMDFRFHRQRSHEDVEGVESVEHESGAPGVR